MYIYIYVCVCTLKPKYIGLTYVYQLSTCGVQGSVSEELDWLAEECGFIRPDHSVFPTKLGNALWQRGAGWLDGWMSTWSTYFASMIPWQYDVICMFWMNIQRHMFDWWGPQFKGAKGDYFVSLFQSLAMWLKLPTGKPSSCNQAPR